MLDSEPENARAYLGKLMAQQQVSKAEALAECQQPFDESDNYQKAYRFGGSNLKADLDSYVKVVRDRLHLEQTDALYQKAEKLMSINKAIRVYEISGPMFFGAADKILDIKIKDYTKCLIIRMRAVPAIDATAMNALESVYDKCKKHGVTLILSHVNEQPMRVMKKSGFYDSVGAANFCNHIDQALKRASKL